MFLARGTRFSIFGHVSRRFVVRLTLAVLGMLVLSLGAYVGLGWAIRSQHSWLLENVPRERYERLYNSYARAAAALFPADSDNDHACDGLEWFCQTNPNNVLDRPQAALEKLGTAPGEDRSRNDFRTAMGEVDLRPQSERYFVVNQRRRVRGFHKFTDVDAPFSQNLHLRLAARRGWLFAPPGGTLAEGALDLPLDANGYYAFDVLPTEQADRGKEGSADWESLVVDGDASRTSGYGIEAILAWPLTSIVPTVEEVRADVVDPGVAKLMQFGWPGIGYRLWWSLPPWEAEGVMVEATEDGANWVPVWTGDSRATSCKLLSRPTGLTAAVLKFRVTPVRYSGPGKVGR